MPLHLIQMKVPRVAEAQRGPVFVEKSKEKEISMGWATTLERKQEIQLVRALDELHRTP